MVRDRYCPLHGSVTVPEQPKKKPNVCPKCSAPLRPDKTCIMGPLCDAVANANSPRPKINERRDAPASQGAPPYERVTNPGFPAPSFDDTTIAEPPERVDFCKGCGLHLDRSCAKCPHCGSSHHPPAAFAASSAKPAPASTRDAYRTVKRGLGSPHAPKFDDDPDVSWEGPEGGSGPKTPDSR